LVVEELCSGCGIQDVVGVPQEIPDDGLEDVLVGYDKAASRVVASLSMDGLVTPSFFYIIIFCLNWSELFLWLKNKD
jgi:hypothetical protein